MVHAGDVARYILSLDKNKNVFTDNVIHLNGRNSYEGNLRLNKYLHIMQMIYMAKYGEKLFDDELLAFDNGAVVDSVMNNYTYYSYHRNYEPALETDIKNYINKMYEILYYAPLNELIDISHRDKEWQKKHEYYLKKDQVMTIDSQADDYRTMFKNFLAVLDND